jgi:glycosyltransferase involved in cell wall biosynthesis
MQPILSICVPTYNRARLLEGLLKCLSFQLEDELLSSVEVVISDNCSI